MPGTFVAEIHAGPVLAPLLVGVVVVSLLALGHRRALTPGRALTVLVATAYAVGVVAVTFFPWQLPFGGTDDVLVGGGPLRRAPGVALHSLLNVVPLVTIDPTTFLLNIVMTVPLGALLPLVVRVRSVPAVALVGLAVSGAIEVGQGVGDVLLGMNRTVDVNDLVANVIGTVLGLLCFHVVSATVGPRLARLALPGSALAPDGTAQTGPAWLVDDLEDADDADVGRRAYASPLVPSGAGSAPVVGASTATSPAASSAVPSRRSPSSA